MQRIACGLVVVPVMALTVMVQAPEVHPHAASGGLVGRWQISRTCTMGCRGSSSLTEEVRARGHNVYTAVGGQTLVLYQVGAQVLVHGSNASSILTIRVPGELMSGPSVAADGNTFTTTWRCIGVAAPYTYAPAAGADGSNQTRSASPPSTRVRC